MFLAAENQLLLADIIAAIRRLDAAFSDLINSVDKLDR